MTDQCWLQCRLCEYRVLRYRGRKLPGAAKMRVHWRQNHQEDYMQIEQRNLRALGTLTDDDEDLAMEGPR